MSHAQEKPAPDLTGYKLKWRRLISHSEVLKVDHLAKKNDNQLIL